MLGVNDFAPAGLAADAHPEFHSHREGGRIAADIDGRGSADTDIAGTAADADTDGEATACGERQDGERGQKDFAHWDLLVHVATRRWRIGRPGAMAWAARMIAFASIP